MTTKKLMAANVKLAILVWLCITLYRTGRSRGHLRPDPAIPAIFLYDASYCDRRPFLPKFWRRLLGLPWPGSYVCPLHPNDKYLEDPGG